MNEGGKGVQEQPAPRKVRLVGSSAADDHPATFIPSIDTRDIFRQMIALEVRNGRLTPARRRRIVRYAAQMGLSAVEAGQLITASRKEVLESDDPTERYHALRLVEPAEERIPVAVILSIVLALAILADLIFIGWLWN